MEIFIKETIVKAGALALTHFRAGVSARTKSSPADLVTEADDQVSDLIIRHIQANYPSHHIYSEERTERINQGAEYEWVIDPIDGTRNFAMGIPVWCVMIALLRHGELLMNAIYNPIAGHLFFAKKGVGSFMNDKPLGVNRIASLDHSMGVIVADNGGVSAVRFQWAINEFLKRSGWLKNFGTMLPACHLAAGGMDFFANNCGMDYDYLPCVLICQEAGAIVTTMEGKPWTREHRDIVIATPEIHGQVLELLRGS